MLIALVIVTASYPAGSSTSISPLAATVSCAFWKLRQGCQKLQGLLPLPCAATKTRASAAVSGNATMENTRSHRRHCPESGSGHERLRFPVAIAAPRVQSGAFRELFSEQLKFATASRSTTGSAVSLISLPRLIRHSARKNAINLSELGWNSATGALSPT